MDAIDPVSQTKVALFHPRQQPWSNHFGWSTDYLIVLGLTAIGRAMVEALKLNWPGVINLRQLLLLAGLHSPKEGQP